MRVMQIYETVGVYLGYGLAMYALSEPRSQLSLQPAPLIVKLS